MATLRIQAVKLLLDTHILLWWIADQSDLPEEARHVIADPEMEVLVSAASAWEIAVKKASGRLEAPEDLELEVARHGFEPLAITFDHARSAGSLPLHHRDPFDRMLIAQARLESLTLVTVDRAFGRYGVDLLLGH
jgi:PIN domain nuclease of toxin-antitoxin system